jgi:hypothetical protein
VAKKKQTIRQALTGGDRDAGVALSRLFRSYGIVTLTDEIIRYLKDGYSSDTITLMLQESPEYKKRFAGNQIREKRGLPVLSPADYLAVESSYKQIMNQAGLPPGFYDQPGDFAKWIGEDVSPTEIQSRVKSAQTLIDSADPGVRSQFDRYYTRGDMVAYALDRKRTAEILERQVRASQIGDAVSDAGIRVDRGMAERIADTGIDAQAARVGGAEAQFRRENLGMLASIEGDVEYGADEAVRDTFLNDSRAADTRRRLASQERARFSGSSGLNETSLSRSRGGAV